MKEAWYEYIHLYAYCVGTEVSPTTLSHRIKNTIK